MSKVTVSFECGLQDMYLLTALFDSLGSLPAHDNHGRMDYGSLRNWPLLVDTVLEITCRLESSMEMTGGEVSLSPRIHKALLAYKSGMPSRIKS